jgi:hypothetical protein
MRLYSQGILTLVGDDMTREEAKQVLGAMVQSDGSLMAVRGHYVHWLPGDPTAILDDVFTADELEAIAVWMRATAGSDA